MIIEGKNSVLEGLKGGKINYIFMQRNSFGGAYQQIIDLCRENNVKLEFVERLVLDRLSQTGKHQSVIGKCDDFNYTTLDNIIDSTPDRHFIALIDNIEDPHNLGSILRSCECAGVTGVIIPARRCCEVNETVIKTSAGACFHLNICKVPNLNDAIRLLKENFITVYALEFGGNDLYKTKLNQDMAFVIGSEGFGVSALTKKLCDDVVSIPLLGHVNSLNASCASTLFVYEVVRQRLYNK